MPLSLLDVSLDRIVTDETCRRPDRMLLDSMVRHGQLGAVELRALPDGRYQLEDGSRRCAVARRLGWKTVRAVVTPADEAACPRDLKAIVANTRRKNLKQLDLARHLRRLMVEGDHSQAELARLIPMSRSTLCEMLKVIECADLVSAIEEDGLEFGAARTLARLLPSARASLLAELRVVATRDGRFPSVRQVEERLRQHEGETSLPDLSETDLSALAEALLGHALPTEIRITRGKQSHVKVTLVLTESDAASIGASLADVDRTTPASAGAWCAGTAA